MRSAGSCRVATVGTPPRGRSGRPRPCWAPGGALAPRCRPPQRACILTRPARARRFVVENSLRIFVGAAILYFVSGSVDINEVHAEDDQEARDDTLERQVNEALLRMQVKQQAALEKALSRFDQLEEQLTSIRAELAEEKARR